MLWKLLFLAFTFIIGPAFAQDLQLSDQVYDIAKQLRCPVCQAESVADSNSDISISMRNTIADLLQEGKSEAEILDYFQARYGDWILMNPPKRGLHLLVWLLPVVAGLLAVGMLVHFTRRWTREARAPSEARPEELERVRRELQRELEGER